MNNLENSYKYCQKIAKNHYENFPVASFLLPKKIRHHIAAVYAFAREADDFADEGDLTAEERLNQLDDYEANLAFIELNKNIKAPIFIALRDTIQKFNIPISLFYDLLSAFKQDVTKNRYSNINEVYDYCRRSANPIGRILLYITNNFTEENAKCSDKICTALQLINFYQDIACDYKTRNRIYLPQNDLKYYMITDNDLLNNEYNDKLLELLNSYIKEAKSMLTSGLKLTDNLSGLFRMEIKLTVLCAEFVANKLLLRNSISVRPTISRWDMLRLIPKAM